MKKRIAIFISGRGSNMKAIVEQCQNGCLKELAEIVLIFANKESAGGLEFAQEVGLDAQWIASKGLKRATFDEKVLALLENYKVDYIILAGYMRVLSSKFVQAYPKKIINIHPADTTAHQGLNGYGWAFENQLASTKVTVHYVDEGLDTGSIIAQYPVDLTGAKTLEEVEQRGLAVEHSCYSKTLQGIFE